MFVSWMLELDDPVLDASLVSVSESCSLSLNDFDGAFSPPALTTSLLFSLNEFEREPPTTSLPDSFGDDFNPSFLDVATFFQPASQLVYTTMKK